MDDVDHPCAHLAAREQAQISIQRAIADDAQADAAGSLALCLRRPFDKLEEVEDERGLYLSALRWLDGGRGQLDAAYGALERLGLANLVAVGLAKREELVVTRDSDTPVAFEPSSPALRLLQQIRDEAHRFAVTFHRQARKMRDLRSELDTVSGVGPRRRRLLLTRFGSLAGVRRATREDLVPVVGERVADALLTHFTRGRVAG